MNSSTYNELPEGIKDYYEKNGGIGIDESLPNGVVRLPDGQEISSEEFYKRYTRRERRAIQRQVAKQK